MLDPQLQSRLASLTPEYRSFLASELPTDIITTFADYYKLTPERSTALGNAVILLLLFMLSQEQFVTFVTLECNLDPDESRSLYHGIVLALPPDIQAAFTATTATLTATEPTPTAVTLAEEIAATEQYFEALPQMRTMAPVLPTEETVYTSTQAAILYEGKTAAAAATPSTTTPPPQNGPRWETEA